MTDRALMVAGAGLAGVVWIGVRAAVLCRPAAASERSEHGGVGGGPGRGERRAGVEAGRAGRPAFETAAGRPTGTRED